jgi:hypothetical protein
MSDQPIEDPKVIEDHPAEPSDKRDSEERRALSEFSRDDTAKSLSMKVKVGSPFRDYFDGTAFSLTAKSATGPFDILPKHHNFISLLVPCELVVRTVDEGEQRIKISGGVMHVKADAINVFLDV